MAAPKKNRNAIGNEGGRPSLYKPEYAEQAYKLCLLGATDVELADFFDVDERTINRWKEDIIEFCQSIHAGKRVADMEVSASLFKTAQDRPVVKQIPFKLKEVTYNKAGKRVEKERVEIVEVQEIIPGDFRSQQFWLKNRKSDKWRDKTEVDNNHTVTQPLIIDWGEND